MGALNNIIIGIPGILYLVKRNLLTKLIGCFSKWLNIIIIIDKYLNCSKL